MASHLPLNALRAFDAAARHMSFRKAADELNVTPAAISQQIRTLESLLGAPLFMRTGRGLRLTPSGQAGLSKLREGLTSLGDAYRQMRPGPASHRVVLRVPPSLCARWLVPRLQDYTAAMPDVELVIQAVDAQIDAADGPVGLVPGNGLNDELSIDIRFGRGIYPGYRVTRLMDATAVPLCSPSLLSGNHPPLATVDDLFAHTLLHDDTEYEGRVGWSDWLRAAKRDPLPAAAQASDQPASALHFNRVSLALDAAAQGQGIVLSLAELARADLETGKLIVPFGPVIPLVNAWYVCCEESSDAHPVLDRVTAWLHEQGMNSEVDIDALVTGSAASRAPVIRHSGAQGPLNRAG